jgi:hypothetical protein
MGRRAVKSGRRSLCTANSLSVLISCRYLLEGFVSSLVGCPYQEGSDGGQSLYNRENAIWTE